MKRSFRKLFIVCRRNTREAQCTLQKLLRYLAQHKISFILDQDTATLFSLTRYPQCVATVKLATLSDLIIAVGGDGSFLSAAQIAVKNQLPIVGINQGTLGFLTDLNQTTFAKLLAILQGNYYREKRRLLSLTINHQRHLALNDVVLLAQTPGRIINCLVDVNQHFLCKYRADGLIIATPTGSTAHALSSGGPILYPTLSNITLVPILSHNLSSRPIVLDQHSKITITFAKANDDLLIICDGQTQATINNTSIHLQLSRKSLELLHPLDYSYFDILRNKLLWEDTSNLSDSYASNTPH